jgi:hypothetical protein
MESQLHADCGCTNNESWQRLVNHCAPLLYGWLRRQNIQHADAEDLVQETLATFDYDTAIPRHRVYQARSGEGGQWAVPGLVRSMGREPMR